MLERELKKLPGVRKVTASHGAGEVSIAVNDGVVLAPGDLDRAMAKHGGYTFSLPSAHRETSQHNASGAPSTRIGGAIVLVVALYLLAKWTGILTYSPEVGSGASLSAVFVIGLVAAVSSCTAVVGGLIAAFSSSYAKAHANASFAAKMTPHLVFNVGRLVGFAGFGALIGLLGQSLALSTTMNGVLVVVVAVLMILLGIQLMDVLPSSYAPRPPKWLSHRIHTLSESDKPWVPGVLGALTFFLPCGFTQSVQLFALTTGSPTQAALTMLVFALGTAPALLGIGAATASMKGIGLKRMTKIVGAMVIVLGLANVRNGAALLGFTGFTWSNADAAFTPVLVDGKQLIQMEVTGGGYEPSDLSVVAGTPVIWEIYGGKVLGCASTLVVPDMKITKRIVTGFNEIAFTPTTPGVYAFSCSMGMYRGTLTVTKAL